MSNLVVAEDIVDFNELSNEEGQHQGLEGLEGWDLYKGIW